MFQFPGLASLAGLLGCPIRKSPDLGVLASTRSLSQLATSFIAFRCLGIPRVSFFFFFLRIAASKIVKLLLCARTKSVFYFSRYCVFLSTCQISLRSYIKQYHHLQEGQDTKIWSSLAYRLTIPIKSLSVENAGFEPATPCLQSRCSSQLS